MHPDDTPLLLLSTCPDTETAERLARHLVEQGLAACVNVLPGIQSFYRWENTLHTDREVLLLIKTRQAQYPQLEAAVLALHPYQVPELIGLPIVTGSAAYLDWLSAASRPLT